MGRLVYSAITSLDGYVADEEGHFEWAAPDEVVHAFINDLERPIGTYLYGRRMYETMVYWETVPVGPDSPEVGRAFAKMWREADKIVYSTTLESVASERTRLERAFDPDAVRALKHATPRDLSVGGASLAAQAFEAGLVDVCRLFVVPVLVGGGTRALAAKVVKRLALVDHRRFEGGMVYLDYRVKA